MARLGAVAFGAFGAFGAMFVAGCGGTEVRGIVREEGTGEPLSGALVQVGDETARTDEDGAFELEVDDDAPALLEVGAIGYEPQRIDVNMDDGRALPSNVSLKKESDERLQTRARFAAEQRRLEEAERNLEADEYELYKARRDSGMQPGSAERFAAEQRRLEVLEERHEAEERALFEARRDFESGAIETWTPPARTEQAGDAEEDADEADEEAADRVRKADEEAAERAEEARDER